MGIIIKGGIKMDWRNQKLYLIDNEKDVEDMTNEEFANYLIENIEGLHKNGMYVRYDERGMVYNISRDEINYQYWNHGLLKHKVEFCEFNGVAPTPSKGNRKKFVGLVKQTIEYIENFELKEKY